MMPDTDMQTALDVAPGALVVQYPLGARDTGPLQGTSSVARWETTRRPVMSSFYRSAPHAAWCGLRARLVACGRAAGKALSSGRQLCHEP
jgi:hypothetical protein